MQSLPFRHQSHRILLFGNPRQQVHVLMRQMHDIAMATWIVHEIDTISVTSDILVVVLAVVADGMITTIVIASNIAIGTFLHVKDIAARAARADTKNGEICGQAVLRVLPRPTITMNYLLAHPGKTSLDVISG